MRPETRNQNPTLIVRFLVCAILVVGTFWVYWPLKHSAFINFDDPFYVSKNRHVLGGLTLSGLKWAFTDLQHSNWHPVTWLSHMLDCQISMNPGIHHFTNLMLHTANALLLLLLLARITGAFWKSALVAALFAWHPLHVESVAWIAERKDLLSTFFGLFSIWAYVLHCQRTATGLKKAKLFYALALLAFALSLMSKPMLVTLPFVLLLLDVWPLQRITLWGEKGISKECRGEAAKLLGEKIPFFILTIASCFITFVAQKTGGAVGKLEFFSIQSRLLNALISYAAYLGKMFWPVKLSIFYPYPSAFPFWQVFLSMALLIGITFVAIKFFRRSPYILIGWLWYLGTLIPVIGLVQVGNQAMADRYSYLPLIGVFIALVWGVTNFWQQRRFPSIGLTLIAVPVVFCCLAFTSTQVRYWENSVTLFQHALHVSEKNALAHHNLAVELADRGNLEEAVTHYHNALSLQPDYASAHLNLGNALNLQGKMDEAVQEYLLAIQQEPFYAKAHFILASTLELQGKLGEAEVHFREAIKSDPTYVEAETELGNLLFQQKKAEDGLVHLRRAVELQPDNAESQYYLAYALALTKDFAGAVQHYWEALKLKPDLAAALNDLAWILATEKNLAQYNPKEAIVLAGRACELTKDQEVRYLNTLAHAHAAAGEVERAVAVAGKAKDVASASKNEGAAQALQKQIDLWRAMQTKAVAR